MHDFESEPQIKQTNQKTVQCFKCIRVPIQLDMLGFAWRNNDVEFPSRNVRIPASSLAKGLLASDSPITQMQDFESEPKIKQTNQKTVQCFKP